MLREVSLYKFQHTSVCVTLPIRSRTLCTVVSNLLCLPVNITESLKFDFLYYRYSSHSLHLYYTDILYYYTLYSKPTFSCNNKSGIIIIISQ